MPGILDDCGKPWEIWGLPPPRRGVPPLSLRRREWSPTSDEFFQRNVDGGVEVGVGRRVDAQGIACAIFERQQFADNRKFMIGGFVVHGILPRVQGRVLKGNRSIRTFEPASPLLWRPVSVLY